MIAPEKEIKYQGLTRLGDPVNWRADISLLSSLIPDWSPGTLENSLAGCVADWKKGVVM